MRFMVMMYPGPDAENGVLPTEQQLTDMGRFNEELVKAGVLLAGEGLHPASAGKRVRWQGGKPVVSDGLAAGGRDVLGGFWILQTRDLEECVAWVKRVPADDRQVIEIRRVFEAEDFGEAFTPELREQEARLRAQAAGN
jgi:hypothetical protein